MLTILSSVLLFAVWLYGISLEWYWYVGIIGGCFVLDVIIGLIKRYCCGCGDLILWDATDIDIDIGPGGDWGDFGGFD